MFSYIVWHAHNFHERWTFNLDNINALHNYFFDNKYMFLT
jgi:hypothetical protein